MFKPVHHVGSPIQQTKSVVQVRSPSHPTKSPQRVDSFKLTHHLASASWLGSPSCPTQSPLEVCSPCRLSSSAHQAQGGSPSQLFKYTDEVDPLSSLTKSARQVGSPSQLTEPSHLTQLTYHLASPSICSLGSGNHIA